MNEAQIVKTAGALEQRFQAQAVLARADRTVTWAVRADRLRRLESLLRDESDRLALAIGTDFGNRAVQETALLELFPSLEGIRHALRHGEGWTKRMRRSTNRWFLPASSMLVPQPLGVVGVVVPWNYPILLAAGPLTAAFAAGNRAMLKVSESTPAFGALFAELAQKYFAPEELWVVNGDADVGRAFCALPFDHLLFTGSTAVGREVMQTAASNLTPVTLELGGKSPAIIGPSAHFEKSVERILAGKLLNAGQTCVAPDYVCLPEGSEERFIRHARDWVRSTYPELAGHEAGVRDFTTIINASHFNRLHALVEDALATGATRSVLSQGANDPARRLFQPVVILGAADSSRVMQEEIFGPILPLVPYRSLEEALAFVNARPHPLALYFFERDRRLIGQVLASTASGGVTINDTLLHAAQDDLPFGGVGPSGLGAYHGRQGFVTFSHLKPVFRQSRINAMSLFAPPYGRLFDRLLRVLLG